MSAIGDGPIEAWTAELQRSGRVVFPLRRQPQLQQTRAAGALLLLLAIANLPHAVQSGGVLRIVGIVVTTAVAIGLCISTWQLLTLRPTLTVDTSGIRLGRRRFVAWSDIDHLTGLDSTGDQLSFAVIPTRGRRKLRLSQRHVRNAAGFRYWLLDRLAEHRRLSASHN